MSGNGGFAHRGNEAFMAVRSRSRVPLGRWVSGDFGTGTHRDPDVGGRERRGVVDSVPGHGYARALVAELAHRVVLALRIDAGGEVLDPEFFGGSLRCRR